jgi:transposase InsO family protein
MKTKDEVFSWFQEFRAQIENQTGNKIKVLRSDNGGEYTSNEFKDFYKKAGIKRELTVSYNPQQNGVVERKNRSIIGSSKAMIHDQEFPMFFGKRHVIQQCMCRTGVLTGYWGTRL